MVLKKNKPFCVGLTGGIGSGKTTVAHFLKAWGVTIIDADEIAREVMSPHNTLYQRVVEHFGSAILTTENILDRQKLRHLIFSNPTEKKWLEDQLHPAILNQMRSQIETCPTSLYCVAVIPLLVETIGSIHFLDRICLIDTPKDLRKQWAAQRDDTSEDQIEIIVESQSKRYEQLALADDVITNDGDLENLHSKTQELHQYYRQLAAKQVD